MTVEELKLEAAKLGYNIIKKVENIKFSPCTCGYNKRDLWWDGKDNMCFYKCKRCEFRGYKGKTQNEAKRNWNKAIDEARKSESN